MKSSTTVSIHVTQGYLLITASELMAASMLTSPIHSQASDGDQVVSMPVGLRSHNQVDRVQVRVEGFGKATH